MRDILVLVLGQRIVTWLEGQLGEWLIPVVFGLLVLLAAWRLWAARCKRNEERIGKLGPADSAGRQEDWAQHLSPKRLDGSRYRAGLVRAMRWVDHRLGAHPFSIGTYDFCLRLAFVYSILAVLFVWLATGMSTGEMLALQPDARKEDGNLIERVSLLVFFSTSIYIYLYCFRRKKWWSITRITIYKTIWVLGAPFRVVSYAILIVITFSVALKSPVLFYLSFIFSGISREIANTVYVISFVVFLLLPFLAFAVSCLHLDACVEIRAYQRRAG